MTRRVCDGCGTRLEGRRRHGFVKGRKLVCGRREREQSVRYPDGGSGLKSRPSPECAA